MLKYTDHFCHHFLDLLHQQDGQIKELKVNQNLSFKKSQNLCKNLTYLVLT